MWATIPFVGGAGSGAVITDITTSGWFSSSGIVKSISKLDGTPLC